MMAKPGVSSRSLGSARRARWVGRTTSLARETSSSVMGISPNNLRLRHSRCIEGFAWLRQGLRWEIQPTQTG